MVNESSEDWWESSLEKMGWAETVTWEHKLGSWESSWDSGLHELGMGCMGTWLVIQESLAVGTRLG